MCYTRGVRTLAGPAFPLAARALLTVTVAVREERRLASRAPMEAFVTPEEERWTGGAPPASAAKRTPADHQPGAVSRQR